MEHQKDSTGKDASSGGHKRTELRMGGGGTDPWGFAGTKGKGPLTCDFLDDSRKVTET